VAQVVQQRVLVHGVLDLGHLGQVLNLEAFHLGAIEENANGEERSQNATEGLVGLEDFHSLLQVHHGFDNFLSKNLFQKK